MLTFTRLGIHGRLGNQLYQYAALRAASLRHDYVCKIPNFNGRIWHSQDCLLKYFNIESEFLSSQDLETIKYVVVDPSTYSSESVGFYFPSMEKIEDHSDVLGFFQNTKYFIDYEEQVKKELSLKKELRDNARNHILMLKDRFNFENLVALHIRTGDQIDGTHPDYHRYKNYYGNGPFDENVPLGKYVEKAINEFPSNTGFMVFVGGSRAGDDQKDLEWAQNTFKDPKFIISNTKNAIKDFALMQNCDHSIISYYSTYSWWAAYTNPNPNKIVIAPQDYHMDEQYNNPNRDGFFPKGWKIL
jgi:hypothetical protein